MAIKNRKTLKDNSLAKNTEVLFDNIVDSMPSVTDDYKYFTTTTTQDFTGLSAQNHTIMIGGAMADGTYIALPEATALNGGMHIKVVFGIACADDLAIGFTDTVILGAAVATGDTNEAADSGTGATAFADVADAFNSVRFDLDTVAAAGGTGGSVLDFFYTGVANRVVYRGSLISEIDNPTLTGHFSTTAVDA
tara:strand:- start:44 stop:622 length:579 start_codon:yes stop_codon:yes gene_type:complete